MRLQRIGKPEAAAYPSFEEYLRERHGRRLALTASAGAVLLAASLAGCERAGANARTAGTPKPPEIHKPAQPPGEPLAPAQVTPPSPKPPVELMGDVACPEPPKPKPVATPAQAESSSQTPAILGKIRAPEPPQVKGGIAAPHAPQAPSE